jgi:hypothetical protein
MSSPDAPTVTPAPDWGRLADGRPWRAARGKDFAEDVPSFIDSARRAAELMGRAMVAMPDPTDSRGHVWVQFADAEVESGAPCPRCGSTRLSLLSFALLRCEACGATLVEQKRRSRRSRTAAEPGEPQQPETPTLTLSEFSQVRLSRTERHADRDEYVGFGVGTDGELALLLVTVPLAHGAPVPDESSPLGYVHSVDFVLGDVWSSADRVDDTWDVVLD